MESWSHGIMDKTKIVGLQFFRDAMIQESMIPI